MREIIMLRTDGAKRGELQTTIGTAITEYWKMLRCSSGTDLFRVVKFFNDGKKQDLQRGCIPYGEDSFDKKEHAAHALDMNDLLNQEAAHALERVVHCFDFHEATTDGGKLVVFAKCTDGVIAVAWHHAGNMAKARKLAYFTVYMYGMMLETEDPELFNTANNQIAVLDILSKEALRLANEYLEK